ncbi:hypothetical protein NLB33_27050 [Mycolicibacterium smegmatis]|uniref:hypothetical protein n=1 Tax=Mycolicibacterium smegmatis TaxID=1772 RepID=UPI0020A3D0B1|nr:hypothetical protein [Mycolicibacterium smegmatis]MCP2626506.1 hypothetical protein [Mycolicibacterium smegmatis]
MTEPTHTETPAADETATEPLSREARYRIERNHAREQLAAATERIARMQRAEIERLAAASLSHPDDLFTLSGNDVADYLTEDGDIDPEKVDADIATIVAERPGLMKPTTPAPAVDRSQGIGVEPPAQPTWHSLLSEAPFAG